MNTNTKTNIILLAILMVMLGVIGSAIYRHVTEPKKEVPAADYHDSAIMVGVYWLTSQNNWSISK